jgi:hypothetical protein
MPQSLSLVQERYLKKIVKVYRVYNQQMGSAEGIIMK